MSAMYVNPKTGKQVPAAGIKERRIGGKTFFIDPEDGEMMLPSEQIAGFTPPPVVQHAQQSVVAPRTPDAPPPLPHRNTSGSASMAPGTQNATQITPVARKKKFAIAGRTPINEFNGSLLTLLLGAFKYPLKGFGIIFMLFSIPCYLGVLYGAWYLKIFFFGYALAYFARIVGSTDYVEQGVPDFPSVADWLDDILRPIILVTSTTLFAFLPVFIYGIVWMVTDMHSSIVLQGLVGFSLLYLPMGLMAVSVLDSISGVNPVKIVRGMLVVGHGYLLAFAVMCAFTILRYYAIDIATGIGNMAIGFCLVSILSFYLLAVEGRMLGLLYYHYERELGWTNYGLPVQPTAPTAPKFAQ